MKNFRIAAVQCRSDLTAHPDDNLTLIDRCLSECRDHGAHLVVFPEAVLSGYVLTAEEARNTALSLEAPAVARAAELSAAHGVAYVFGMFESDGGRFFNSALLAHEGRVVAVHRKVHAPPRERGFFSLGDGFDVQELPFVRAGLSICYDNEISESHLCLAVRGAELIVMPTAWADHWEREDYVERAETDDEVVAERVRWMHMMFGARCRDTGTFSVLANYAGLKGVGPARYVGKSMIFAPTGRVLAEAAAWEEDVIYADLDARLLSAYRDMEAFGMRGRRPEVYGSLVDPLNRRV